MTLPTLPALPVMPTGSSIDWTKWRAEFDSIVAQRAAIFEQYRGDNLAAQTLAMTANTEALTLMKQAQDRFTDVQTQLIPLLEPGSAGSADGMVSIDTARQWEKDGRADTKASMLAAIREAEPGTPPAS